MVYETKTYKRLHELTPEGKAAYEAILEDAADEILFRHQHPFRWLARKIKEMF